MGRKSKPRSSSTGPPNLGPKLNDPSSTNGSSDNKHRLISPPSEEMKFGTGVFKTSSQQPDQQSRENAKQLSNREKKRLKAEFYKDWHQRKDKLKIQASEVQNDKQEIQNLRRELELLKLNTQQQPSKATTNNQSQQQQQALQQANFQKSRKNHRFNDITKLEAHSAKIMLPDEYQALPEVVPIRGKDYTLTRKILEILDAKMDHVRIFLTWLDCLFEAKHDIMKAIAKELEPFFDTPSRRSCLRARNIFIMCRRVERRHIEPTGSCFILLDKSFKGALGDKDSIDLDILDTRVRMIEVVPQMLISQIKSENLLVFRDGFKQQLCEILPDNLSRSCSIAFRWYQAPDRKQPPANNDPISTTTKSHPSISAQISASQESVSSGPSQKEVKSKEVDFSTITSPIDYTLPWVSTMNHNPDGLSITRTAPTLTVTGQSRTSQAPKNNLPLSENQSPPAIIRPTTIANVVVAKTEAKKKSSTNNTQPQVQTQPKLVAEKKKIVQPKKVGSRIAANFGPIDASKISDCELEATLLLHEEKNDHASSYVKENLQKLMQYGDIVLRIDNLPAKLTVHALNLMMGTYSIAEKQLVACSTPGPKGKQCMNVRIVLKDGNPDIQRILIKDRAKTAYNTILIIKKTSLKELEKFMMKNHDKMIKLEADQLLPVTTIGYSSVAPAQIAVSN